ncbi:TetR/AcrR family transcriptional regulator [Catellatospora citrea]|uniref:TetR family transcriptional regulator n=1 Tax=Catellatospora citrea TaxID=53366 RepID=A0A8J3KTF3_9ACTN|nr:TetR/AcrR family transcriptional regulator [Catellatospora citrea]RKE10831.1 TetR family transcriptional regulator [Catellatospora citrea]GIG00930.1 TetR family transcriptional regulator [Catellatospora citrea]
MPDPDTTLRARLIEVGVDLLTREGPGSLTLREIARRAGVSHGAPRRYFPSHLSLLSAIAQVGYQDLGGRIAGLRDEADPRAGLLTLGRDYLDFARTQRGMFELMFRHELLRGNQIGLRDASRQLFGVLVDLVTRARHGLAAPEPVVVAGALWANLHGIAQLWLWGSLQMTVQTDDVDPLLRAALDAHLGPA